MTDKKSEQEIIQPMLAMAHRAAFDSYSTALCVVDAKGIIVDINKAAMSLFGILSRKRLCDRKICIFNNNCFDVTLDGGILSSQDMRVNCRFNCNIAWSRDPDSFFKTGTLHLSLLFHNVYDDDGQPQFVMTEITDLTNEKEQKEMMQIYSKNMSSLLRSAGVTLWIYDIKAGRRLLINGPDLFPAYSDMNSFMRHIHPSDMPVLKSAIELIKEGKRTDGHCSIRIKKNPDAAQYVSLDTFCMGQLGSHNLSFITFLTIDITEKIKYLRELRVNENKLSLVKGDYEHVSSLLYSLIDVMPLIFFVKDVDHDFRYLMVNDMFREKVSLTNGDVIGHNDAEIIQGKDDVLNYRRNDLKAVELGSLSVKEETRLGNKRKVWRTSKFCIKTQNGHTLLIGLSQDITEIDEAYRALEVAKEKAEQSDKLKSAFLANMSHEIRTPLNSIIGFSSVLSQTDNADERDEYSQIVMQNGKTLISIIDNILDMSKIEAGYLELDNKPVDLSIFFSEVRDNFQPLMKDGVSFKCDFPAGHCTILSDKNRLMQVVNNLMSNAIKYTPSGIITLGYECKDGRFSFYVLDTGIGVSEQNLKKLFSRFEKLDSYAHGTGLGLSICKLLAEKMGGGITCDSVEGMGARFSFWMPCQVV